jgi:hypothetical protein
MGRHAAADGAGTDPIVAAALAQQDAAAGRSHATADTTDPAVERGLGWPGDTTTGGGLGWPGSLDTAEGDAAGDDTGGGAAEGSAAVDETARMGAVPAVPEPRATTEDGTGDDVPGPPARRGWWRVFGGTAA